MDPEAVALLPRAEGERQRAGSLVGRWRPELHGGVQSRGKLARWVIQGWGNNLHSQRTLIPPAAQVERTEVLRSCSSPVFSRVLALEYLFEEKQPLQFHVFDAEDGATSPSSDTFLGSTECTLGQVCILTSPHSHQLLPLKSKITESMLSGKFHLGLDPISTIHWLCSLRKDI